MLDVPSLPDSPIRRRVVERANLDITEGELLVLGKSFFNNVLYFLYNVFCEQLKLLKLYGKIHLTVEK